MPNLTVNVPANCVADLTAAAQAMAAAQTPPVDTSAMTAVQLGQWYVARILRDVVVNQRRGKAQTTAQTSVDTAVATAQTDAGGIA